LFDWVTASAAYKANYQFTRRPFAADSLGNTLTNGNTKSLNGQLNFITLYNKIPFLKKINNKGKGGKGGKDNKSKSTSDTTKKKSINIVEEIFKVVTLMYYFYP
jgi:cell surface protein SprA